MFANRKFKKRVREVCFKHKIDKTNPKMHGTLVAPPTDEECIVLIRDMSNDSIKLNKILNHIDGLGIKIG